MAQGGHGNICVFEDFQGALAQTLSDATEYNYNDLRLAAISGDVAMSISVTQPNGIATFSGAGGAVDGIGIYSMPFQPSTQGTISMEIRWKTSALTTYGFFIGWQETVSVAEPVNPFTLSGTTLTSNDGGNAFGAYYDTTATTDDVRVHVSVDGAEATTALTEGGTAYGALGIRAVTTLTADSWMYARAEIDPDGAARFYYGDVILDPENTGPKLIASLKAGVLDATALYHPIAILIDPSTNDPLHSVDFFGASAGRSWAY
jgi:hypothetical protein